MNELNSDDMPMHARYYIADVFSRTHNKHIWDAKMNRMICNTYLQPYRLNKKGHTTEQGIRDQLGNLTKFCQHCMNLV